MPSMISLGVQNTKNNNAFAFDAVKQLVRKPVSQSTAETAIVNRPSLGMFCKRLDRATDLREKFVSETGPLGFIPFLRIACVRFCLAQYNDAPTHD